jgi:hypothetical protein
VVNLFKTKDDFNIPIKTTFQEKLAQPGTCRVIDLQAKFVVDLQKLRAKQ